jgi:hypothetical protein
MSRDRMEEVQVELKTLRAQLVTPAERAALSAEVAEEARVLAARLAALEQENAALELRLAAARKSRPKETTASWVAALAVLTPLYLALTVFLVASTLVVSQGLNATFFGGALFAGGLGLARWSRRA